MHSNSADRLPPGAKALRLSPRPGEERRGPFPPGQVPDGFPLPYHLDPRAAPPSLPRSCPGGEDGGVGAVKRWAGEVVHRRVDDEELLLSLPPRRLRRLGVEHPGEQNPRVPHEHPTRLEDG